MITIIGVAHVFDISRNLENAIIERNPSVVCVELDSARFQALYSSGGERDLPFIYMMLANFQKKIAKKYGTEVGREMITAVETAKMLNAKLACIDMEASKIVSEFWRSMTRVERIKLLFALFTSIFIRKKRIEKELKRFEENDEYYLESFGREFPTAKSVLIDERNVHMAESIKKLSVEHENIVAVVGDGHVEGIRKLLGLSNVETIRLSQLRQKESIKMDEVTISYEIPYEN
ncbi:MAG: TraB/GumN family protein [Methanomassiliicoccales archaeon]|nr:MAG: TraB/GumN family protein [Methanomassiliicoccales archaeon]